ncbi:MAG: nucleotide exchange factor GrpE [Acidobacteria bacterium]|nr:nucleotide exchange factor GrpE [Acidobacteriota bacterium]
MATPDSIQLDANEPTTDESLQTKTSASTPAEIASDIATNADAAPANASFDDLLKQLRVRKFAASSLVDETDEAGETEEAGEADEADEADELSANQADYFATNDRAPTDASALTPPLESTTVTGERDADNSDAPSPPTSMADSATASITPADNAGLYHRPFAKSFNDAIEQVKARHSLLNITALYHTVQEPTALPHYEHGDDLTSDDDDDDDLDEAAPVLEEVIEELAQEVRKVGREVFKTNRNAERNQAAVEDAIAEIRQLASIVEEIPAQARQTVADAVFDAKAQICREVLRVADAMEASLKAADDLLTKLQSQQPQSGNPWLLKLMPSHQLHESLDEALAALQKWRDGQQLIYQRVMAILHSAGARVIDAQVFDPKLQRVVSIAQNAALSNGTVVGEELKGYTLDGKILRYAEVIVIKNE